MRLHIFRRDFRIHDNTALNTSSRETLGMFIMDPFQLNPENKHYSFHAVNFMFTALKDLDQQLQKYNSRLIILYGNPETVLESWIKKNKPVEISFNRDFSPYSYIRDKKIENISKKYKIKLLANTKDNFLHELDEVKSANGDPYTVFGYYYKNARKIQPDKPYKKFTKWKSHKKSYLHEIDSRESKLIKPSEDPDFTIVSRKKAEEFLEIDINYENNREKINCPTTKLSPFFKFGLIGMREAFLAFEKVSEELVRQLYWRSHYFLLAAARTQTLASEMNYELSKKQEKEFIERFYSMEKMPQFKTVNWEYQHYNAMWQGNTGFPLIDACIRCLNTTGWLHNRGRLAVANFSIKILHLSMPSGQIAFSARLIDGSYASNFGNWAWILGPYDPGGYRYGTKNTFGGRIFKEVINPRKIDPKLQFIKKWVPELKNVPDSDIANWHEKHVNYKVYQSPIVNFHEQLRKWDKLTKK